MLDCLGFGDWIEGIRGDWAASRDEEDEENKEKGEIGSSCDFFFLFPFLLDCWKRDAEFGAECWCLEFFSMGSAARDMLACPCRSRTQRVRELVKRRDRKNLVIELCVTFNFIRKFLRG
jgi:hypothetical protein